MVNRFNVSRLAGVKYRVLSANCAIWVLASTMVASARNKSREVIWEDRNVDILKICLSYDDQLSTGACSCPFMYLPRSVPDIYCTGEYIPQYSRLSFPGPSQLQPYTVLWKAFGWGPKRQAKRCWSTSWIDELAPSNSDRVGIYDSSYVGEASSPLTPAYADKVAYTYSHLPPGQRGRYIQYNLLFGYQRRKPGHLTVYTAPSKWDQQIVLQVYRDNCGSPGEEAIGWKE